MLNNIPESIRRASRSTIINHPNTSSCNILRKSTLHNGGVIDTPKYGGLTMIDQEDDADYEYLFIANGYILPVEVFNQTQLSDNSYTADNPKDVKYFLIETETEGILLKIHDIIFMIISLSFNLRIAFEIVAIDTVINIPPYVNKYQCNRRLDLDVISDLTKFN